MSTLGSLVRGGVKGGVKTGAKMGRAFTTASERAIASETKVMAAAQKEIKQLKDQMAKYEKEAAKNAAKAEKALNDGAKKGLFGTGVGVKGALAATAAV